MRPTLTCPYCKQSETDTLGGSSLQARYPVSRRRALAGLKWLAVLASVSGNLNVGTPAIAQTRPQASKPAATAVPRELADELPDALVSGTARLTFFGFQVYDSTLWITPGFKASDYARYAFALQLDYLRNLSGTAIAERSIKEMRGVANFSPEQEQRWLKAMQDAFPDIKAGDRIIGLHTPGLGARFWYNGQVRPAVADTEFSRAFFGIWLSDKTSEPALRRSLLERSTP